MSNDERPKSKKKKNEWVIVAFSAIILLILLLLLVNFSSTKNREKSQNGKKSPSSPVSEEAEEEIPLGETERKLENEISSLIPQVPYTGREDVVNSRTTEERVNNCLQRQRKILEIWWQEREIFFTYPTSAQTFLNLIEQAREKSESVIAAASCPRNPDGSPNYTGLWKEAKENEKWWLDSESEEKTRIIKKVIEREINPQLIKSIGQLPQDFNKSPQGINKWARDYICAWMPGVRLASLREAIGEELGQNFDCDFSLKKLTLNRLNPLKKYFTVEIINSLKLSGQEE